MEGASSKVAKTVYKICPVTFTHLIHNQRLKRLLRKGDVKSDTSNDFKIKKKNPQKALSGNNDDKNNDHNLHTTFLQRKNHHLSST